MDIHNGEQIFNRNNDSESAHGYQDPIFKAGIPYLPGLSNRLIIILKRLNIKTLFNKVNDALHKILGSV